jgi:Zn-dependent protease
MEMLANGLLWYVVFLYSMAFHEAAHAFVAFRLGDRTAYDGGQVTLNPVPHIRREPFGTVVVPILSYALGGWMIGWASTPYDPHWAARYPRRSSLMSLAGPAANGLLVLAAALFVHLGISVGLFAQPESVGFSRIVVPVSAGFFSPLATLVSILFSLNLLLALFNLMPVPPFDGSGAVVLFLTESGARRYSSLIRHPSASFIGLLVAWRFFGVVFYPLHRFAINLLYFGSAYG